MAVVGIVVGALSTLTLIAGTVAVVWLSDGSEITSRNAEVGQCADVDTDDGKVVLTEVPCSESHDAQIFAIHELTSNEVQLFEDRELGQVEVCLIEARNEIVIPHDQKGRLTLKHQRVQVNGALANPSDPRAGDDILCYLEAVDQPIAVDLLS